MRRIAILFIGLISFSGCFYNSDIPEDQDVWEYSQPLQEGLSEDALLQLNTELNDGFFDSIYSVHILKNDKLIFENYYKGGDRNTVYNVGRVGIGWFSAMFGKILEEELDGNLDVPINTYFPEYADLFAATPDMNNITIRHVLEMKTGLSWNELIRFPFENDADVRLIQESSDPIGYLLEKPMDGFAGARFAYNTASCLLLVKIAEEIVQEPITEYLDRNFFDPIGANVSYTYLNDGTPNIPWGLELTALDALKVNYLIFKKGNWFGEQLISESWIEEITTTSISLNATNTYGLYWQTLGEGTFLSDAYGVSDTFFQYGDNTQAVYFSESENLVVFVNADIITGNFGNFSFSIYLRILDSDNQQF